MFRAILFLFLIQFVQPHWSTLCAQPMVAVQNDTVQQLIKTQSEQLKALRSQQLEDSIKRIQLEEQLKTMQRLNTRDRSELTQQLIELKSRDSLSLIAQKQRIDSLRKLRKGAAVAPFRDSIFTLYTGTGSFSVQDRAEAVSRRIRNLADNFNFIPDSIRLFTDDGTIHLFWQDHDILGINERDALWMNTDKMSLAKTYKEIIRDTIIQYRNETSWQTLVKEAGFAILVIIIVAFILFGINKLVRYAKKKIASKKGSLFKGLRFKGYEVINPNRQIKVLWTALTIIKWILVFSIIYLALPILFNIFPHTKGYADILLSYFLAPLKKIIHAIVDYFPKLITIAVIVAVFFYLLRVLKFFAMEVQRGAFHVNGFYPDWALPTYQLLRVLILAFMMVVAFPYLPGSESPIFKGVSVFIGVLFTFGSAGALGNIVAGMVLTYMRAFSIGDRVKIGEVSGDIIEKSLLVTRVRTIKNEIISIPNATVMNSHTINFSSDAPDKGLIVHTTLTMGYEIAWQQVHELAIKAALRVPLIEKEPSPFVLQTSLDDFYVSYQVNAYTKHPNKQAVIYSDLHRELLDVFHDAGIEIMSPHYRAQRDGNGMLIPPDNKLK